MKEANKRKKKIIFLSLQGLGNSIINLSAVIPLTTNFEVKVVCFANGSKSLFQQFGIETIEVKSLFALFWSAVREKADFAVSPFPMWRRERLFLFFSRAITKVSFGQILVLNLFSKKVVLEFSRDSHDIENNRRILEYFDLGSISLSKELESRGFKTPVRSGVLSIHPTASTVFKYFPISFWVELLSLMPQKMKIYCFCGRSIEERQFCESLKNSLISVRQDIVFEIFSNRDFQFICRRISESEGFIGLDSSIMHLSALLEKPIVALWSFADIKRIYPFTSNTCTVYAPREVISSPLKSYPTGQLPWMERADANDLADRVSSVFGSRDFVDKFSVVEF